MPQIASPVTPNANANANATAASGAIAAPAAWSASVSVRALCEFTAKHGDLDRRFTPTATALEGLWGQQTVASRRCPEYETEIALEAVCGPLRVRGRADGHDPRRACLEEVKTIRGHPDEIPPNRRLLHWAQLQTYGALFCRARGLPEITLALVYFDVVTQSEVELRQVFGADELESVFTERCAAYMEWAEQEVAHRTARDAALTALPFPQPAFRRGQRGLAQAVYRAAANGHVLLAQAPTGIGKTVGTLFPTLRAMPAAGIDKIAYLTCKGTGRLGAMETLEDLRAGTAGQALRVVAVVPKDQACEHPDKACHPDACPLARGFYDRLPDARQDAVAEGWLDAPAQRRIALRHGICPYYLGQDLMRWGDVLVGDVHHLCDANGQLWGLMQALDWTVAVLVDEAHGLVDRTRQMYSAEIRLGQLRCSVQAAPAALSSPLQALVSAIEHQVQTVAERTAHNTAAEAAAPYAVLPAAPDALTQALQAATASLAEHFNRHPLLQGPLLNLQFELQRFGRLLDALGDHSLFDLQLESATGVDDADAVLCVRNVVPAAWLRPRWRDVHSATLFSATLSPPDYLIKLLGLPEGTAWIDVPPAFAPEHLTVQVAGISTRWADRDKSLPRLLRVLVQQFDQHPGNYLAFFSSFDYLDKAAAGLAALRPDIPRWRQDRQQDRKMGPQARQDFLARFQPHGQGIGFAVLGGVFAEGVDLPGSLLIGAFIATLGLPPVSPVQEAMAARLDQLFGAEHGYADRVPAMQKVVQAAGRVLRTPHDRGWLWLLDDRYRRADVARLLPPQWGLAPA